MVAVVQSRLVMLLRFPKSCAKIARAEGVVGSVSRQRPNTKYSASLKTQEVEEVGGCVVPPATAKDLFLSITNNNSMKKELLEEAISDISAIVYETIMDYQEDGEEEDADYLLSQLVMVKDAIAAIVKIKEL